jgi:hypothetical protein
MSYEDEILIKIVRKLDKNLKFWMLDVVWDKKLNYLKKKDLVILLVLKKSINC